MAGVAAYFDLDGTLLDASSEKTLLHLSLSDAHGGYRGAQQCGHLA